MQNVTYGSAMQKMLIKAFLGNLKMNMRHPFQLAMKPGPKVYKASSKRGKRQRQLNNWR